MAGKAFLNPIKYLDRTDVSTAAFFRFLHRESSAYDSDPLDEDLRKDGIEMVAPHRSNRRTRMRRCH